MCIIITMINQTKKDSLKSAIPLMSLHVGLNAIIVALSTFVPITSFFLVIFLPLISTLCCLKINWKGYLIYLVASILLSTIIAIQNLSIIFLNLVPSILQGFVFSYVIKKNKDGTIAFIISTFILFLFYVLFIPFLNFIYEIDIINISLTLLGLASLKNIGLFVYPGIFMISTFEVFLVSIITKGEIKKLGYNLVFFENVSLFILIGNALFSFFNLIFFFFKIYQISYMFLTISLIFMIILSIQLIKEKILIFLPSLIGFIIISWIIYIALAPSFGYLASFNILSISNILLGLEGIIYYSCSSKRTKKSQQDV